MLSLHGLLEAIENRRAPLFSVLTSHPGRQEESRAR